MTMPNEADGRERLLAGTLHGRPRDLFRQAAMWILRRLFSLHVIGEELIPAEGALLVVSNHVSNADPPLLELVFPRPLFFMGKSELFGVPLVGWIVRRFGGFPVVRGTADRAAMRHAIDVLHHGIALGVYPEGGRSRTGALKGAHPGAGLLALHSGAPVLPVAVTGTEYLPVNGEWPPRRPKGASDPIVVRFGQPFNIPEQVDGKRVTPQEAVQLIMHRIAELLPDRYQGEYPQRA